jgi:hypothetical protein
MDDCTDPLSFGRREFAIETGLIERPEACVVVNDAILRPTALQRQPQEDRIDT